MKAAIISFSSIIVFAILGNTQTTVPPDSTCFSQCYVNAENATPCPNNGAADYEDFDPACLCSDKVWLEVFGGCILNSQEPCPNSNDSDASTALYYVEQMCANVQEPIEVATATSPGDTGNILTPAATDTSVSSCLAACFTSSIPTGTCHSTDTGCLCNNVGFAENVENCILTAASCAALIDPALQAVKQACSAAGTNISFTSTSAVSTTSSTSSAPPPPLPASPVPTPKPTDPGAPSPLPIPSPTYLTSPEGGSGSSGALSAFPDLGTGMAVLYAVAFLLC